MDTVPKDGRSRLLQPSRATGAPSKGTGGASISESTGLVGAVAEAIRKSQTYYLSQQHEDGYWWYELESNATMTSEYLMLLHFLGLKDEERDAKMVRHILRTQRSDGTWSIHWGGKGDLSTTVEAYFALKLAGFSANDEPLRKAREFILENGGVEGARVFTKIFLALFGEFDWKAIPSIPVEMNLLPSWFPLNIYSLSSWARSTLVPLSVVLEFKPVRPVPERARVRELYKDPYRTPRLTTKRLSLLSWKKLFIVADRLVRVMEHFSVRPLRRKALKRTESWLLKHQEPSGDWAGIQPAMVNSILALVAMGHDRSFEPIARGLEALKRFTIEKDDELLLQACISPVWDTVLASLSLLCSGTDKTHPSVVAACKWLASKQIFQKGDWSVKRQNTKPGGWAFEFENSWYPDVDDTAVVLMLLHRYSDREFIKSENLESGLQWILGMQGKDGGWGSFDADNNMRMWNQVPFGDLEAMIDPSTPDLTGRVLECLGLFGHKLSEDHVQRAIGFLKSTQEEDGSWWGRWGVNYINGTWSALMGLASIGEDPSNPYIEKATRWLKSIQRPDGGWGECCESYEDPRLKVHGASTASQTAWAIMGLIAAGEGTSQEVSRGVKFLVDRQKTDGTWDEEEFTGTGFPKYFMIRYHNYRNCFPLMALGRFLSQSGRNEKVLR